MLFGVKNGPPTFQRAMTKTFRKYLLNFFMKFFWMILQFTMTWRFICRSLDYVFRNARNTTSI
jgi:hypothetical protein